VRKPKRIEIHTLARADVEAAFDHYLEQVGSAVALGFLDAFERACLAAGRSPSAGSPRFAEELNLPGLRHVLLKGYPYLVFYMEQDDHLRVWRVLHGHRDIPERMRDSG